MQILHFSDLHNNDLALNAAARVAARWSDAHVCITGDACNGKARAIFKFDGLHNPGYWFVPGNHDKPVSERLGHLFSPKWRTPYLAILEDCVLVGLEIERDEEAEAQLMEIQILPESLEKRVLVVLNHWKLSSFVRKTFLMWVRENFPTVVSIVLLRGHNHPSDFFAEITTDDVIIVSRVYSANIYFGHGGIPGCANLISIEKDGKVTAQTVYDPKETDVRDGFIERTTWGAIPHGTHWRYGRPNARNGPPTYQLESGEDPLAVIDAYWRWFVAYKS